MVTATELLHYQIRGNYGKYTFRDSVRFLITNLTDFLGFITGGLIKVGELEKRQERIYRYCQNVSKAYHQYEADKSPKSKTTLEKCYDEFLVFASGLDYSSFEMRIYDRWGELIFRSNDIYKGWNGKRNNTGDLVQQDVYVWKVTFRDFDQTPHQYIGHVTIVK